MTQKKHLKGDMEKRQANNTKGSVRCTLTSSSALAEENSYRRQQLPAGMLHQHAHSEAGSGGH